jgi:hypothetical protein
VKRRECANFPKQPQTIGIDCPHFGPDTAGHATNGPTNYLEHISGPLKMSESAPVFGKCEGAF